MRSDFLSATFAAVRQRQFKGTLVALVLLAFVSLTPTNAFATITVTPTPMISGAGPYTWTYSVNLVGFSSIDAGDFFTILDFAGFVPGTQTVVANWTASSANSGVCPADLAGTCAGFDDPAVPNLTWTYTGTGIANPNTNPATVFFLGNFAANSTFNMPRNDWFFSRDNDLAAPHTDEGAGGNTNVPASVPEPSSLLLFGSGLTALAFARRKLVRH